MFDTGRLGGYPDILVVQIKKLLLWSYTKDTWRNGSTVRFYGGFIKNCYMTV